MKLTPVCSSSLFSWQGAGAACLLAWLAACGEPATVEPETPVAPPAIEAPANTTPATTDTPAAEPAAASDADEAEANVLGHPALWSLSDEDTTIYIFGTIHLLRPDLDWRTEAFNAALSSADVVITEADVFSAEAQGELMQAVIGGGTFQDGRSLADVLDAEDEAVVTKALDSLSLPFAAIAPLRPWFAALQLTTSAAMGAGYDPQAGVDAVIITEATAAAKELRYLETGVEQINFFANMPEADQIAFLVATADAIVNEPDMLDRLVLDWAEGDVAAIGDMMADVDSIGSQEVYDVILKRRNENWVPKIEVLLDEPGVFFIAVGAGHLAGDDSVVTMLRGRGHEVVGP